MLQKPSGVSDHFWRTDWKSKLSSAYQITEGHREAYREIYKLKYQKSNVKYICISFMNGKISLTKAHSVLLLCLNYFIEKTHVISRLWPQ